MRGKLTKALWLLVTLNLMVVGICPLAPATLLPASHNGQCQHERVPAGGPHSCCVSVHHQPALVRPTLENYFALPAPATALTPMVRAAQVSAIGTTSLTPSPPRLPSVLRM